MYVVLALLCTGPTLECMVRAYPNIMPSHDICIATKETVHEKLWKYAPENATRVKTWCIPIPEDT